MDMIFLVLLVVAVLSETVLFVLFFREKKRTGTRLRAMQQYAESVEKSANSYILECIDSLFGIDKRAKNLESQVYLLKGEVYYNGERISSVESDIFDCATSFNKELEALGKSAGDRIDKLGKELADDRTETLHAVHDVLSEHDKKYTSALKEINEKISDLALDYTEAQEAAGKVNSYASSLAHIFDYDPVAAAKRNREKGMG